MQLLKTCQPRLFDPAIHVMLDDLINIFTLKVSWYTEQHASLRQFNRIRVLSIRNVFSKRYNLQCLVSLNLESKHIRNKRLQKLVQTLIVEIYQYEKYQSVRKLDLKKIQFYFVTTISIRTWSKTWTKSNYRSDYCSHSFATCVTAKFLNRRLLAIHQSWKS